MTNAVCVDVLVFICMDLNRPEPATKIKRENRIC
jgi:hypothetical protein